MSDEVLWWEESTVNLGSILDKRPGYYPVKKLKEEIAGYSVTFNDQFWAFVTCNGTGVVWSQ